MKISDRATATLMHATARWTVRYGKDLYFAGEGLPQPRRSLVPTRHGDVPVFVYTDPAWSEADGPRATYVNFHGGAWLMRYPQMDDFWCRYLVAEAGIAVVNVDFTTGPYVTYPVSQQQCADVVTWLRGEASGYGERLGVDGRRLAVGGFSSGGGLAASVCLQLRDTGHEQPRMQLLAVPALDVATDPPRGPATISPALRALVRRVYFPDPATRHEAYASPLRAADVSGLAPAVVLTAERDSLRPDGDEYARMLADAGVEVLWHDTTPGVDHYFLTEDLTRARTTMARTAAILHERLA